MRGYADIGYSTSHCVHFIEASEIDVEVLTEMVHSLRDRGFGIAYVDCMPLVDRPYQILCHVRVAELQQWCAERNLPIDGATRAQFVSFMLKRKYAGALYIGN